MANQIIDAIRKAKAKTSAPQQPQTQNTPAPEAEMSGMDIQGMSMKDMIESAMGTPDKGSSMTLTLNGNQFNTPQDIANVISKIPEIMKLLSVSMEPDADNQEMNPEM